MQIFSNTFETLYLKVKFRIVKIQELSGPRTSIYSIILDGEDSTLLEKFVIENESKFPSEVEYLLNKLEIMGNKTGAPDYYFTGGEGNLGDQVCVLKDIPAKKLRLYCIRLGNCTLILGGGGYKNVRALQDDPKLKAENYLLREVSHLLGERLKERDISIDYKTNDLFGNLVFKEDESE